MNNIDLEGFIEVEITEELEHKFEHALQVADRLERLSANPAFTHRTKSLYGAIREHIDVLQGKAPKRKNTSFGDLDFFDWQVRWGEAILKEAARSIIRH
jgi:hypothetical protein